MAKNSALATHFKDEDFFLQHLLSRTATVTLKLDLDDLKWAFLPSASCAFGSCASFIKRRRREIIEPSASALGKRWKEPRRFGTRAFERDKDD